MTRTLRLVLGDQLTRSLSSLRDIDARTDIVLMVEVDAEATYVRHHKQKIVFILSAMRHFADKLRADGIHVDYVRLDDPFNSQSFDGEIARALERHRPERLVVTEPGEQRVLDMIRGWQDRHGVPVSIRDDDRFFCSRAEFVRWVHGRASPRMEYFYREMRRRSGYLMDGEQPVGGAWNFDSQNRKALPKTRSVVPRKAFEPDAVTREVIGLVAARYAGHFGDIDGFAWATTREDARVALDVFIARHLPHFGDYQDAMKSGDDFVHHSAISPYLNAGLLTAREVCDAAVAAYAAGAAPLNAVEGFVRQVLGWREYVRGIYWWRMPGYAATNHFEAKRDLPAFFWTGSTDLNCLAQAIGSTRRNAYAHHIQRLMVIGNFALLAGLAPGQVEEWFLIVYADAFEWVELPNVHGMVLHADGGLLGSKPYAASGAYIDRMSDYCAGCRYSPKEKNGPDACPFNYLYWNFLLANRDKLSGNPRMSMPYRTLSAMAPSKVRRIVDDSNSFLDRLD